MLSAECDAWIDVAVDASPGGGRDAFRIGTVRAIAGNSPTPTLDAPGIIDRGGRTRVGYRGSSGCQQGQHGQHCIAHDLVSSASAAAGVLRLTLKRCRLRNVPAALYSTFMPANSATFFHFSVSATIIAPKASGGPTSGSPPSSIRRVLIAGSANTVLISLFSFSMISFGVFFGAPMPNSALAS